MIKAKRAEDADIGAEAKVTYSFKVTLEHAGFLDHVLIATKRMPADWLTEVLREEMARVGLQLPDELNEPNEQKPKQGELFSGTTK